MTTAEAILTAVTWWGVIGGIVAVVFLGYGIDRIDEDADGAFVFRPLLVPGIVVIWPLVLWRWYCLASGRDHWAHRHRPRRHRHRIFAYAMPIAIVAVIVAGLAVRQSWPDHIAPERLSPPAEDSQ
ncbi:hypothetical protein [Pseudaestuariivita atlantica]|uniref:Uncharacterized protein n=1 Tax=Pseudaestuariivita atlantica TaxID=1317121 RepID=A0A0L1JR97_9RHOB|nr:hypothetical protein [Pseudaestuariivita atlantica]KNG94237.1 hypothetical protein ATO11_08445 [Pseudaestuariivita atlantica]